VLEDERITRWGGLFVICSRGDDGEGVFGGGNERNDLATGPRRDVPSRLHCSRGGLWLLVGVGGGVWVLLVSVGRVGRRVKKVRRGR
jgi:hypothetical protein